MSDDPARTLFETLRSEAGRAVRGPAHLARLARSARALGIPLDEAEARAALADLPDATSRLRLTVRPSGDVRLESWPFAPEPAGTVVRIGWAEETVRSSDPARRHKSRDRAAYDRASRRAAKEGLADLLFVNERGELVEGAISTLFAEIDGRVWTPPLASGALPGVLRATWLDDGLAREATLRPDDLRRATRLWIGSSLRGARRATLTP